MAGDLGETPFVSENQPVETQKKRQVKRKILILFVTLLFFGVCLFVWKFFFSGVNESLGPQQAAPITITDSKSETDLDQEAQTPVPIPSLSQHESEHFRVGEIAIGGEAGLIVPESDPSPLEILVVRGESFAEKGKNKAKLVITWETNKPAISEISYGKGIGQAEGVIREESYGTSHSLIIPDLSPASTYVYVISGKDKWGNRVESEPYAVYTGSREVSLFELIAGAVGDVFGWAVDR